MRLKKTYSSREVAALTGLSARQLQLWDVGGLMRSAIPPRRTSAGGFTERRYTPNEVFELLALAELRARDFTVHQLQSTIDTLRTRFGVTLFEATVGGGGHVQLLTDGIRLFARTDAGEFYNLLEEPTQPLLAVGDELKLKAIEGRVPSKRARR